jgi:hypothetical protein
MSRRFLIVLGGGITYLIACSDPAGVASRRSDDLTVPLKVSSDGVFKQPIAGTISFVGGGSLGGFRMTPSGRCFFLNAEVIDHFEGDLVGPVIFDENERAPCDFTHLTGSGPAVAHVTWNGVSGTIAGQWTTNCKADASQPIGLSCDGTMNMRGSDGLDGVQFHFKWGPGWYPFSYSGTASSH